MLKILIPTDLSSNAHRATAYAAELFKHGPAQLVLMHAYADQVYQAQEAQDEKALKNAKVSCLQQAETALQGLKQDIFSIAPNPKHEVRCAPEFGRLVDSVNQWVEAENFDIVVMGTKGQTADKQLTFGSNTLQVIKNVTCPVLAIPEDANLTYPKDILFTTDFLRPHRRREMKLLANLAKRFAAKIHFLYVSDFEELSSRQQKNKEFLSSLFEENHVEFHQKSGKDITAVVNEFLATQAIDMLVMVNTRHSYLENILYQSTIEKIGLNIDIPFLVMQNLSR